MPDIELHASTSLEHAGDLMERYGPDARLLAGGTDLLVDLKGGRVSARHLVSLNQIDALRGISNEDEGLLIGALTTVTELNQSPAIRERFDAILDASSQMAAPPIRNAATIGGNIASAVPCADLPPILIAMGASVRLWSRDGERAMPLDEFITAVRCTALRANEILTAIHVPTPSRGFGAAYVRFGLREGNAIPVAGVAVGLVLADDQRIQDARVVLGAVAPVPKMVKSAASILVDSVIGEDVFAAAARAAMEAAEPISDIRGSADFRRELIDVLTRRALTTACNRAKGNR